MGCCGGFVGQVLNSPTQAVTNVVNTALKNPFQTAALVATAIYAPELIDSLSGGSELGADVIPASTPSVATSAAEADQMSGLTDLGYGQTGAVTPSMYAPTAGSTGMTLPGSVNASGLSNTYGLQVAPSGGAGLSTASLPTGASSIATDAGSTLAGMNPATIDAAAMTAGTGTTLADVAKAASGVAAGASLLNQGTGSGGGGTNYGFAQPQQLSGTVSGGKAVQVTPYNENLPALAAYHSPNVTPVSTYGIVPSYKSLSSPTYAKEGGEIHDHVGHTEYPKSPLETVFSTRGGTHYVQGKGTGQSDDIDAKLADGEYVFDADTVAALGDGSNKAGAQALDKMREAIRAHKRSAPDNKIPPKAKQPFAYLKEGNK